MWKTEVAIKMCISKQLFFLFLVNHEKLLVGLAKCLKNLSEAVHFQYSYFSGISQGFYLDFKLHIFFLLHFRFPMEHIFSEYLFFPPIHAGWPRNYTITN